MHPMFMRKINVVLNGKREGRGTTFVHDFSKHKSVGGVNNRSEVLMEKGRGVREATMVGHSTPRALTLGSSLPSPMILASHIIMET